MNTFDGLIQSMVEDSSGMTTLNLNIKNDIIKARITTKSVNILKLKINDKVFANIKTVAIIS
jgi:ABC-type molybdate transport system ATPase subunit